MTSQHRALLAVCTPILSHWCQWQTFHALQQCGSGPWTLCTQVQYLLPARMVFSKTMASGWCKMYYRRLLMGSSGYCSWAATLICSTVQKPAFPKAELYSVPERADEHPPPRPAAGLSPSPRPCGRHGTGTMAWEAQHTGQEPTRILPGPIHNTPRDGANLNTSRCWQLCVLGFNPTLLFSKALLCCNTSNQLKLNNLPRENVQWRGNIKVCTRKRPDYLSFLIRHTALETKYSLKIYIINCLRQDT